MHALLKRSVAITTLCLSLLPITTWAEQMSSLEQLVNGPHRSEANKARNEYRHPQQTLEWFGLRPDMTVVEIFPSGGWYTEIIAPYVNEKGKYYGAGFDPDSQVDFMRNVTKRLDEKLSANPELYSNATITVLAPPAKTAIAPPGSADMVLTFRNVHNWMAAGTEADVFKAMFTALKPGGILGLVEHRGNPDTAQDPKAKTGYVNQDYVIQLAKTAGFEFVGSSEINANPKDTKDHPKGVWTLPPTLRLKDQDKDKYLAIGESDRMTLKFKKP